MNLLPEVTKPQGSDDFGNLFATATAALLNKAGSIRLFTNGAFRLICRPELHAGEAKTVKSPANIAGVGTKPCKSAGSCRIVVPWYPPKKNNLFFLIGPPSVP